MVLSRLRPSWPYTPCRPKPRVFSFQHFDLRPGYRQALKRDVVLLVFGEQHRPRASIDDRCMGEKSGVRFSHLGLCILVAGRPHGCHLEVVAELGVFFVPGGLPGHGG